MKRKMKKMLMLFFVMAAMLGITQISAMAAEKASGTWGDNLTWVLDNEGTLTISGTGEMEDAEEEYPWGDYYEEIVSIVVEKGVTTIGDSAFLWYPNLTSVELNSGLVSVGSGAFAECSKLSEVVIPEGVTTLESGAFAWCSSLKKVTIPSSVTSIGESAFEDCGITSIVIPSSITKIEAFTFSHCTKLKTVTIPSMVTVIGEYAFNSCSVLTSITIPSGVTTIGEEAFGDCDGLTSITIPSSVSSIGTGAFRDCDSLKKIILEDGNKNYSAKDGVLFNKNKTTILYYPNGKTGSSYTIPTGVKKVAEYAFGSNKFLKTVTVPSSVTVVEDSAMGDSWGEYCISTIRFEGDMPDLASGFYPAGTVYYPATWKEDPSKKVWGEWEEAVKWITYKTPVLSSVSNTSKGVTVKWNKVAGASKYRVFRKSGSGSWAKVGDTTSTSYTDTTAKSGTTYTYTVRCLSSDGKVYISGYNKTGKSIKYLAKPKLSSAANTASGVTVKWAKVTGASGYYVYRKTGSGSFAKIATIKSGSTVSYSDTAVKSKNGTKYIYTVRAYSGKTLSSYESGKTIVRLTSSSISSLKNSASKKMTVKWAQNSKATGYQVQYSTSSKFSSAATKTITGYKNVSKTITSLTKGKTYYVRVRSYKTVSGVNYYSGWSTAKSVKISK